MPVRISASRRPAGAIAERLRGPVDEGLLTEVCAAFRLSPDQPVPMLPFNHVVGQETRRLYYYLAVGDDGLLSPEPVLNGGSATDSGQLPVTRLVSFGLCNAACPYCKRDCQFVDGDGVPIPTVQVPLRELFALTAGACLRGEIIRFSGGDPVMFPEVTMALATYARRNGGSASIAHNGTGPAWVSRLAPLLSSAAIDVKAAPEKIARVMGVPDPVGRRWFETAFASVNAVTDAGVVCEIRTPVFADTTMADVTEIATRIAALDRQRVFWTWRVHKPVNGCDWPAPEIPALAEMLQAVSATLPGQWMGMRARWERGGMLFVRDGQVVNGREAAAVCDGDEARGSGNQTQRRPPPPRRAGDARHCTPETPMVSMSPGYGQRPETLPRG